MNRGYTNRAKVMAITLMSVITSAGLSPEAQADKGAAFLGGMIGGHILTNAANRSERRTEADEQMAAQSQTAAAQPAAAPAAAPASSSQSVEDKLKTLDKLAAGGYISKEEYKKRRQAILDSL